MPTALRWFLRLIPLNPIAVRLVQSGSRRSKHAFLRAGYLAMLIIALLWTLLIATGGGELSYGELAAAGASSFAWIATLQIALICILSPVFLAGAIAQESSPKTWDILLTTPLTSGQIVLGNLLGRLFFVLALLVASLPLFALTQYFGGVPGTSIFASLFIAACAAFLVGSIAIALSVSRLVGKRAVFAFYVTIVTYLAISAAFDVWLRSTGGGAGPTGNGVTWVTSLNPFLSLHALLNPATYPRAEVGEFPGLFGFMLARPVTAWCAFAGGISVALLLASMVTVRAGGIQTMGQGKGGIPVFRRMFGLGAQGGEHRAPRVVWMNPIAWREASARNATIGKIFARWSFIAAGVILGIIIVAFFHTGDVDIPGFRLILSAVIWTETAVVALVAINMAATAVSREREDGTLDLLLTTPITPGMYLSGKIRGLIAYLIPMIAVPTFTLLIAGIYVFFGGFGRTGGVTSSATAIGAAQTVEIPAILPEAGLLYGLVALPFLAFCVVIGLNWSLKSKGTLSAVAMTVGIVGVIAGTIGLCGWRSGIDIEVIGPALAAMNPVTISYAIINPYEGLLETVLNGSGGLTTARVSLAIGVPISAALHLLVVFIVHASMKRNFDFTVRKLAGTS